MNSEIVMRVKEMERLFNEVSGAIAENGGSLPENDDIISMVRTLSRYMDSGLWLSDYEADERGELPPGLRRGVLSQDGLYNLLKDTESLLKQ